MLTAAGTVVVVMRVLGALNMKVVYRDNFGSCSGELLKVASTYLLSYLDPLPHLHQHIPLNLELTIHNLLVRGST